MFKGKIRAKSVIGIELGNDFSSQGTAFLIAAYAPDVGNPITKTSSIAPGTSAGFEIPTKGVGHMRILVDFEAIDDSGRLTVTVNGKVRDPKPEEPPGIFGDTTWTYSIE